MNFKDMLRQDLAVFLNDQEFAELHTVDGVSCCCILQGNISKKAELLADYTNMLIIGEDQLSSPVKQAGDTMIVDRTIYTIESWDVQAGVHYIALSTNMQY